MRKPPQRSDDEFVEDGDEAESTAESVGNEDKGAQATGVDDIGNQGVAQAPMVETTANQGVPIVDTVTEQGVSDTTNSSRPHRLRSKKARNYHKHLHVPVGVTLDYIIKGKVMVIMDD